MRDSLGDFSLDDGLSLEDFQTSVEIDTATSDYPLATAIESNLPIYDGRVVSPGQYKEWTKVLSNSPGAFVIKHSWRDLSPIDSATAIFNEIIASERAVGIEPQGQTTASGTACKSYV